ncbi:hypothetical protein NDU88_006961 [Pleurodeles waltl]|uniref:Uncharacterized protein n=1 Tax=Pleurodeles waltl TaxID=8319 RepID=A0AAV7UR36_PLEWA|nr:hypothetical protein NDU88_006961 [Pleurodeles waltl]
MAELEIREAASAATPRPAPWSLHGSRSSRGNPRDLSVGRAAYRDLSAGRGALRDPGAGCGRINVPCRGNLSPQPRRAPQRVPRHNRNVRKKYFFSQI